MPRNPTASPSACDRPGARRSMIEPNATAKIGSDPLIRPVMPDAMCCSASGKSVNGIAIHSTDTATSRGRSSRHRAVPSGRDQPERRRSEDDPEPRDQPGFERVQADRDQQERRAPDDADRHEQHPVERGERAEVRSRRRRHHAPAPRPRLGVRMARSARSLQPGDRTRAAVPDRPRGAPPRP